ncbi:MAG: hypothetical protein A3F11_00610 [Gammaproteobacteria bacterium RIFCSPHIGHO2_12_FULL_37_14]|nr:MAG: hypothetical protein A3F11_00610 [Gammaproteobacteria bacterium RIFCSPHIGHO2_12_FULL_37_14]
MKNSNKSTHKTNIIRCFNKAANTYDIHSNIQQQVGCKLIALIDTTQAQPINIIDLGCGSGFITEKLAIKYKYSNFHAIDIADRLLLEAKKRLSAYPIKIDENDFDEFDNNDSLFDLVFSNMALQWSIDLNSTLLRIHKNMSEGGIIAIALPLEGTYSELAVQSRNQFHTESFIANLFDQCGFKKINYSVEYLTAHYDSWMTAIKTVKATGANYVFKKSTNALYSNSYLYKLIKSHQTMSNPVSLTYHIGYFIAMKK